MADPIPPTLLLTAAYPSPREPHRGGFIESLALGLAKQGRIAVVTPRTHPDDPEKETRNGLPIHRFSYRTDGRPLKQTPGLPLLTLGSYVYEGIRTAVRVCNNLGPDAVIYAHWAVPSGPIALATGLRTGAPILLHCHGSDLRTAPGRGRSVRAAVRTSLAGSGLVAVASGDLRDRVVDDFGVRPDRVSILRCGIDLSRFQPGDREAARTRLDLPGDATIFVFVGDCLKAKGLDLLFEAARPILQNRDDALFLLIGDGPFREPIEAQTRETGLSERFRFLGPVPNESLAPFLRAADALVLPSRSEGTPVSVMEAMAVGRPVIATAVGGIPEIVKSGETGFLVPSDNPDALRRTLLHFLDALPESRRRLEEEAESTRARFDVGTRIPAIATLLEELNPRKRRNGTGSRTHYDRFWAETNLEKRDARSLERARLALELARDDRGRPPRRVLDLGSGRGIASALFAAAGSEVWAVDASAVAVARTRTRDPRIRAVACDFEREPLPFDLDFDCVLSLEVLEHLTDPATVLERLRTRTSADGCWIVSLPNENNWFHALGHRLGKANPDHVRRFDPDSAAEFLARFGQVEVRRPVPLTPPRWRGVRGIGTLLADWLPSAFSISTLFRLRPHRCDARSSSASC